MAFYGGKQLLIIKHSTSVHDHGQDTDMGFKRYVNIMDLDGNIYVENKMISKINKQQQDKLAFELSSAFNLIVKLLEELQSFFMNKMINETKQLKSDLFIFKRK